MNIGIYCKQTHFDLEETLLSLFQELRKFKAKIWIHQESKHLITNKLLALLPELFFLEDELQIDSLDYFMTIGGDGTFLSGLAAINYRQIPMLGINTGRLGFLADITPNEVEQALQCIQNKRYQIEKRMMLETNKLADKHPFYALNEITVHKQDTSSMIMVHTYIDEEFLATYMADGLIVSSPTGSTAYNLSAGGPIISPDSDNIVITPIAPHNLTARPLVIPGNKKITLKIECRDESFRLAADTNSMVLCQGTEIIIQKAAHSCAVIKLNKHSFAKTIRNKLMWGVDKRF